MNAPAHKRHRRAGSAAPAGDETIERAMEEAIDTVSSVDGALETTAMELRARNGSAAGDTSSIRIGRLLGTVVVSVHGELDVPRATHLGAILADLIDGQGNMSLVVDLQNASAADADSLWVFTDAAERASRRGASMRLREAPEPIHQALELRGLDAFLGTEAQ